VASRPRGKTLVEAAVESVEEARAAERAGAGRVELCANLAEGGTTPSAGMIAACRAAVRIPVYVMIRPRGGNFSYSKEELDVMQRDIDVARELGADGVVFGVLTRARLIDQRVTRELVALSRPLDVTFHRAIDASRDPLGALDILFRCGVDRVLTSGGADRAMDGVKTIAAMVEQAGQRIVVIAGGSVRPRNVAGLVKKTSVREVHLRGTDAAIVRGVVAALR
jgi:copper homeostasis protein